ncbi:hypothetical protein X801_09693, partial [Opisthorchis viverrini]
MESIVLSALQLMDKADNGERIFADIRWSERTRKNTPQPINSTNKHTNDRSLIILGVPEPNETSDKIPQNTHDYMQWQFLCSTFEIENVAVVDTYRIPKSPKHMGTDPRPLKLTLLRGDMLNLIQTQWQRHRNLLLRELRISTSMRNNIPTEETKVNEDEAISETSKNDQLPTPPGNKVNTLVVNDKKDYQLMFFEKTEKNPKLPYWIINNKASVKPGTSPLHTANGLTDTASAAAEELSEFYSTVYCQKEYPTKASVKKSPVTKPTVSAKTGPKVPFKIFEDPVSANCQHCGSERRKPSLPCRERVSTTSVGVQACDTDIREWLCAEKPTEGYWEELAERRRVALKETLDENRELCTLVESLNKEIERLNQIEQQAEHFARMYK